jgi:hypothetical protein
VNLALQLTLPPLTFAAVTALALAVGLPGIGPAATVGTLAFALVLVAVLVRLSPERR